MDRCVFCGYEGDDFVPEHWIPNWLNRALFPKHASGVIHRMPGQEPWKANAFELTVKHVCRPCNNSWMSDIESQARDYVGPMILGQTTQKQITAGGLRRVVRWCYLKVISLELGRPAEHDPTHHPPLYNAFRVTRNPPYPNCSLALGVRDIEDENPDFVWFVSQGFIFEANLPTHPAAAGYHTTLLVGHLVVDVFGLTEPHILDTEHEEGLHVLWPLMVQGGTFTWPPTRRFRGVEDGRLV